MISGYWDHKLFKKIYERKFDFDIKEQELWETVHFDPSAYTLGRVGAADRPISRFGHWHPN
jgi:hypothetical protein